MVINPNSFFFKWYLWYKPMDQWPRTMCELLLRFTLLTLIYTFVLNAIIRIGHSLIVYGNLIALNADKTDNILLIISSFSSILFIGITATLAFVIAVLLVAGTVMYSVGFCVSKCLDHTPSVVLNMTRSAVTRIKDKTCNLITYKY